MCACVCVRERERERERERKEIYVCLRVCVYVVFVSMHVCSSVSIYTHTYPRIFKR